MNKLVLLCVTFVFGMVIGKVEFGQLWLLQAQEAVPTADWVETATPVELGNSKDGLVKRVDEIEKLLKSIVREGKIISGLSNKVLVVNAIDILPPSVNARNDANYVLTVRADEAEAQLSMSTIGNKRRIEQIGIHLGKFNGEDNVARFLLRSKNLGDSKDFANKIVELAKSNSK